MKRILVAIFVGAMMMFPAASFASSSSCLAYNAPSVCSASASRTTAASPANTTSATSATSAGSLPFTGLDVGLLAAGGVALLGAGLIVRKLSSSTE